MAKDIKVSIAYDELWVEITAEGVSYAPDAVHDMMTQAIRAFSDTIAELRGHGVINTDDEDEDEYEEEEEIAVDLEEE
jgi:hypothetical protein